MIFSRWERVPSKSPHRSKSDYWEQSCEASKHLPCPTHLLDVFEKYLNDEDSSSTCSESMPEHEGAYKSINKDYFSTAYVEGNSKALTFVHICDDSNSSTTVDSVFQKFAEIHWRSANFFRIPGSSCHSLLEKMHINRCPTILAFKNGKIIDRLSHFGESDYFTLDGECRMLRAWAGQVISEHIHEVSSHATEHHLQSIAVHAGMAHMSRRP